MTRAERDELAKMLEEIAASLDAAPDRAKANAAVEAEKLRAQFPSLYTERDALYPYQVGALQAEATHGARRIRSVIAAFLASRRRAA
jgi:hypothetical protein